MTLDIKQLDMRWLKKLTDPKSAGDFNAFMDKLPQHAGQTVLIAAGIAWAMAAALGLYASIQARQLTELRAEFQKTDALTPIVPQILDVPIPSADVDTFIKKAEKSYDGLTFGVSGSDIVISSSLTSNFAKFREAIGHVQNGGPGWRVALDKMCVGRECGDNNKISVSLKINKVSVENPKPATELPKQK